MSRLSLSAELFVDLHLDVTGHECNSCSVLHSYIMFVYICILLCCYLTWKNLYKCSTKGLKQSIVCDCVPTQGCGYVSAEGVWL